MKKFNKALMMIVAVLLTFVLISSCFVSSTMAKYVITKQATSTATLSKFGVTLTVTTPSGSGLTGSVDATTVKGGTGGTGSLVYKLSNVQINPGDDYFNAARFTVSGKTTTNARVVISVDLDYTPDTFSAPSGVGGTTATTYFMPLGFTFSSGKTSAEGNYVAGPWISGTTSSDMEVADVETKIRDGIKAKITKPAAPSTTTINGVPSLYNTFNKATVQWTIAGTASLKTFDMGFAWPETYTDTTDYDYDVLGTYLANKANGATVDITYTVTIEQT